jgi:DHA2 family multidrug resistance protein-like MFS transporter
MALLLLGPPAPEYRDPNARRLDLLSVAMSLAAILAVIFGLKQTAQDGFSPLPAASIVAGLVIGLLFLRRQSRLSDPLIDIRLFRIPTFNVALATNVIAIFVAVGYFLFVAQYRSWCQLSPLQAGLGHCLRRWIRRIHLAPRSSTAPPGARARRIACSGSGRLPCSPRLRIDRSAHCGCSPVVISLALSPVFTLTTELDRGKRLPERAGQPLNI